MGAMKDDSLYVVNGFYAAMRAKYVAPGASVYYYSVQWDSSSMSWADFRGSLLGATDPEAGLYLPARSIEIIDAAQPAATLEQLAAEANGPLRGALENAEPGFQAALDQAVEENDWAPLRAWLSQNDGGGTGGPAAAIRG